MAEELTIDEFARRVGTTSRNIRAHQARGLLPAPHMVGRVGYYSNEHVARMQLVCRLQRRGFSLAAIKALLDARENGATLSEVLGLETALRANGAHEVRELVSRERVEILPDPWRRRRAAGLGLVVNANEH